VDLADILERQLEVFRCEKDSTVDGNWRVVPYIPPDIRQRGVGGVVAEADSLQAALDGVIKFTTYQSQRADFFPLRIKLVLIRRRGHRLMG
jgi:hypothetical protein